MSNPLAGYEETVICPYDKCHVIMKHRIQTHLIKCARNHAHIKLEVCPFDATHRFQSSEKKQHLAECPSRGNFDRYLYRIETGSASAQAKQPEPAPKLNGDDENWDHYNTPTYDPKKYALNAKVLRNPSLMTPSERKRFADDERKRLGELDRRQQ